MRATGDMLVDVPFFALLDASEREVLAERVSFMEVGEGTVLFEVNDPGDHMFIVLSGEIEIYFRDSTGDRILLETARRGDFFGEISLLDPGPRTASAMATADVTALVVDRDDLDELFRLKPDAALHLLTGTGRRLRQNAELLRKTASRNVNLEEEPLTTAGRIADAISAASGSMPFLIFHVFFFVAWILLNVDVMPFKDFDPYPFSFLTLVVSLEAIILSVFVLLSANRSAARDRVRGDIEYKVNLKAELEIAHLHEKIDRLQAEVLGRMAQVLREGRSRAEP